MTHSLSDSIKMAVRSILDRPPVAVILAYHRVASIPWDPHQLCVSPGHFEQQMRLVREEAQLLRLRDMTPGSQGVEVRSRGVVITFDDGYADNWQIAAPILASLGIPATFFVTTGMVDSGREFFADELIHLTLLAVSLAEPLRATVGGETLRLSGEGLSEPAKGDAGRRAERGTGGQERWERLYGQLHRLLRGQSKETREDILWELRRQVGVAAGVACESHRTLSADDLRSLAQEDLFEVGAHAVDHLVLRDLPAEEQARQIQGSKLQLESILSRPVESFAYPYGSEWDVSPITIDLVRQAEFRRACANVPGQVRRDSNPHWLPRHLVRDWGQAEFRQRLKGFFSPHPVANPVSA